VDTQTIVILDFGSQDTQLIARRIRELNVFSVVLPCTAPLSEIQALHPLGVILSGGPSSVYDADAPAADPGILSLGVPALGICYGLHFIVHHLGGKVLSAPRREYGHAEVTIEDHATPLFQGLPPTLAVWMSHGDEAAEPTSSAASGPCNSTPRCITLRSALSSSRTSSSPSAARAAIGHPRISSNPQ
jgi:GMP synthase (glutamine-hydrolysing)